MFIGLAAFVGLRLLVNQATAQPVDTLAVLDVPYVAQSEVLCGGAAAAMVMRYWGAQGIYAEDFAPYVSSDAGIRTGDLVAALDSLGWQPYPFRGTAADVKGHLKRGRPVVALLEVAPHRYHYVVVIAWSETGVLYHDPAAAPNRVLPAAQWEEQWQATGYWALLLLPPAEETSPADTTATVPVAIEDDQDRPCAPQVARAIAQAQSGQLDDAMTQLAAAQTQCPEEAAAFREAAAIRFKQARWMEAEQLAEQALAREPDDGYTWRLLAATRFLSEDRTGALLAWNQLGEPEIDLIQIEGLDRMRYAAAASLLGLSPGDILTPFKLMRARRRLKLLPAADASQVYYEPRPERKVEVQAVLLEAPVFINGWRTLAEHLAKTLPRRLLSVHVNNVMGGGEQLTATWRWQVNRPYVSVEMAAPRVLGLPGVLSVEGRWDRHTYRVPASFGEADNRFIEERQRGAVRLQDWATARLRWRSEVGFQRWQHRANDLTLDVTLVYRPLSARWALRSGVGGGLPLEGNARYGGGHLGVFWQSKSELSGTLVVAQSGVVATSAETPLAGWVGADSGLGGMLRAHKLRDNGVVDSKLFGRTLVHGSVEFQQWLGAISIFPVGVATFFDTAQVWHRLDPDTDSRLQVDTGGGLRLGLPGGASYLRLDAAYGLRDGKYELSVGWEALLE